MFERFTERARQVVVLAQDEARALGHDYIGTEHLLLGAAARGGRARRADAARPRRDGRDGARAGARARRAGREQHHDGQIPFSPRGKQALELALREALGLGHNHIGTEHVLLGLVHHDGGNASTVLHALGRDEETVRNEVMRRLGGPTRTVTLHPWPRVRRPWPAAEEVSDSEPLAGRRGVTLPSASQLAVAWLLFALALGAGILIGWAIWGHVALRSSP